MWILTIFAPVEYPIKFDKVNSAWSITYIKGSQVSCIIVCLSLKNDFVLANSADPHEMPHHAAFHLVLHYLPKNQCRGFRSKSEREMHITYRPLYSCYPH